MVENKVYTRIPDGWRVLEGTVTQPKGTLWICNGKSIFDKEYRRALYRTGEDKDGGATDK